MKITKLSLIAALTISAAFAGGDIAPVEPVAEAPAPAPQKVSESTITGAVKLWYGTADTGASGNLFNKDGSFGDAAFNLRYTREVMSGVTLNAGVSGVSTLGLENELVSATWVNHGTTNPLGDVVWLDIFNAQIQLANTTLVLGRQELATPFFFSEKWNIVANTFDAAVVVNTDLPSTTLVGAWVGRGNGTGNGQVVDLNNDNFGGGHIAFTAASKPAYALAAVNKSISNTTLQAWYYQIPSVATAYWLQADVDMSGLTLGGQYAGTKLTASGATTDAWAAKIGYSADALSAYAAYSVRSNDKGIDISNIATGHATSQSSLYTEAYWNYGKVGSQDAQSFAVGAGYDLGAAQINAQYTSVSSAINDNDLSEFALSASTKIGPVNADIAYVNADVGTAATSNTLLVMLSMPFSL